MFLDCQVILKNYVIKESYDFMGGIYSLYITTLQSCVSGIILNVSGVFNLLRDFARSLHLMLWMKTLQGKSPLRQVL